MFTGIFSSCSAGKSEHNMDISSRPVSQFLVRGFMLPQGCIPSACVPGLCSIFSASCSYRCNCMTCVPARRIMFGKLTDCDGIWHYEARQCQTRRCGSAGLIMTGLMRQGTAVSLRSTPLFWMLLLVVMVERLTSAATEVSVERDCIPELSGEV